MEKEHVEYESKNGKFNSFGEFVNHYYAKLVYDDGRVSIKDIISNPPATIVLWSDDTKTVVKCSENDIYDFEKGLAMCFAKKAISNNGNYYNLFKTAFAMYKKKYDKEPLIGNEKKKEKKENESDSYGNWISVDDRMPQTFDSVLFTGINSLGIYFLAQMGYYDGREWNVLGRSLELKKVGATVTHWMPLPKSPKPEEVPRDA